MGGNHHFHPFKTGGLWSSRQLKKINTLKKMGQRAAKQRNISTKKSLIFTSIHVGTLNGSFFWRGVGTLLFLKHPVGEIQHISGAVDTVNKSTDTNTCKQ